MKVKETALPGVLVIEPRVFSDDRGFFLETFQASRYAPLGIPTEFAQDNLSRSVRGTLRGLHFQEPDAQGKLVQVTRGTVLDVAVDVRRGSPTFGRWVGVELSGDTPRQMWIPAGFAHGFCVTSEFADFWYKCTTPYAPQSERSIRWDDPAIGIAWPIAKPLLSKKDAEAPTLNDAPVLPTY
ncbi:MAG: rfbC [Myxococcales bacterium]|nr:rfbC [Myxococcales bacterium]